MNWSREDIDLCFVREFSAGGTQLSGVISSAERRDQIRIAIWRANKAEKQFFDSGMTYAGAFRACYGVSIESRRTARPVAPRRIEEEPNVQG